MTQQDKAKAASAAKKAHEALEARELFIRGALVAQEADIPAAFFAHNKKLIKDIAALEHKSRKQDVLVDEEALFDFYNQRLPENYMPSENGARPETPAVGRILESDKNQTTANNVGWVSAPRVTQQTAESAATSTAVGRILESDNSAGAKKGRLKSEKPSDSKIRPTRVLLSNCFYFVNLFFEWVSDGLF